MEKNTRRYMDCCEGKVGDGEIEYSNYLCSGCWYQWFNQNNTQCPFPYCKEKLFQEPLKEPVDRSSHCQCCHKQYANSLSIEEMVSFMTS